MSCFLGIDLGTSYFKAGLFDSGGEQLGMGRRSVEITVNPDGKYELAIPEFWRIINLAIAEAICDAGIAAKDIEALSWSSQANSFVLLDKSYEPLTPLILWPDERGDGPPAGLIARSDFKSATGLGIAPENGAMIAKTEWFRRERPELWNQTGYIMSISDYLAFSLTGQRVGDLGTASMTGLLDARRRKWWEDALDICGIREEQLSTPLEMGTKIGYITPEGAELTGLSSRTQVYSGGLDHHLVALGAGVTRRNLISESTGTVLACVGYGEGFEQQDGVNLAPGPDEGHYFRMAFDANGASALEWYRKHHAPGLTISQLLTLAEGVEPGCGGLIAKPCADKYPGLEGFENIRKTHSAGHFTRAILESTGRSLENLVQLITWRRVAGAIVASGGGARSRLWLQIKADLLGMDVVVPQSGELACRGAAICAMGIPDIDLWPVEQHRITPVKTEIKTL